MSGCNAPDAAPIFHSAIVRNTRSEWVVFSGAGQNGSTRSAPDWRISCLWKFANASFWRYHERAGGPDRAGRLRKFARANLIFEGCYAAARTSDVRLGDKVRSLRDLHDHFSEWNSFVRWCESNANPSLRTCLKPKPERPLGHNCAPIGQASLFENVAADEMSLLFEAAMDGGLHWGEFLK